MKDFNKDKIIDAKYVNIDEKLEKKATKVIRGEPLFYTTTQVAKMVEVEPSTIRFWTKRFKDLLDVEFSNKNRQYKKVDIEKLKFIKKLTKEDGLTLKQVDEYCSEEGFDMEDIEKNVMDSSNPLAIQTIISALTVEFNKELDSKLSNLKQTILQEIEKRNDTVHENIVTTVDEIVTEKLDKSLKEFQVHVDKKELETTKRLAETEKILKQHMKEKQLLEEKLEKEKHKSFFSKLFKKK